MAFIMVKLMAFIYKKIFLAIGLLFLLGADVFAQATPSGWTTYFRFRKYAQGANPGADSLNQNWIDIDHQIRARGWTWKGTSNIYPYDTTITKVHIRTNQSDTTGTALLNIYGTSAFNDDIAANGNDLTTTQATFNLLNTTATTINFGGAATTAILFSSGNRFISDRNNGRPRFTFGSSAGTGVTGKAYLPDSLYSLTTQFMDASRNLFNLGYIYGTGFKNVGNSFGTGQVGFLSGELVLSNSTENDFQTRGGQFAINRKDTSQPSNIRYAATIVNQFRGDGGVGYKGEGGLYVILIDQSGKPSGVGQGINIDIRPERENGNAWGGTGGTYTVNEDTYGLGITSNGSKFMIDGIFMDAGSKTTTTQNPNGIGINGGLTLGGKYGSMFSAASGSNAHIGIDLSSMTGYGGADDRAIKLSTTSRSDFGYISIQGGAQILAGAGSPEGAITAPPGSLFLNNNGGAGTSLYVKESGSGNTGWVAK